MSNLALIADRRGRDRWKDVIFIVAALALMALSIGATTSKATGKPIEHTWSLQVIDPQTNLALQN